MRPGSTYIHYPLPMYFPSSIEQIELTESRSILTYLTQINSGSLYFMFSYPCQVSNVNLELSKWDNWIPCSVSTVRVSCLGRPLPIIHPITTTGIITSDWACWWRRPTILSFWISSCWRCDHVIVQIDAVIHFKLKLILDGSEGYQNVKLPIITHTGFRFWTWLNLELRPPAPNI